MKLLSCLPLLVPNVGRDTARSLIQERLYPESAFGDRLSLSKIASDIGEGMLLQVNDPSLSLSYGEFPLTSIDSFLDRALRHRSDSSDPVTFIDIGSGCGRICCYLALTRPWNIYGIELLAPLHEAAFAVVARAVDEGYFVEQAETIVRDQEQRIATIELHEGSGFDYQAMIERADIIFCYSTAFPSQDFDPSIGAPILTRDWNDLFRRCKPGSLLLTTDRAVDPRCGWDLMDVIELPNPEVFESTCFVQKKSYRSLVAS